ncbi:MAG: GTP-dependent dephospho-CoA kinase family protein [Candidatus Bathyarchaeales archaeon]
MPTTYILPQKLQRQLKRPWGTLIRGSFSETANILEEILKKEKPPSIISVGDTVSKNLVKNKIFPNLLIIDNKVMRTAIKPASLPADKEMHVKNPPGTITKEALNTVQEAFKANCRVKIVVDGEEDLLTLAAAFYAPENSIVIYGQPHEGIVVVKVTQEKKAEVAQILKEMEKAAKD